MKTLLINICCFVLLILLSNLAYGQTVISFVGNPNAESVSVCVGESVSIDSMLPPINLDTCILSDSESWQFLGKEGYVSINPNNPNDIFHFDNSGILQVIPNGDVDPIKIRLIPIWVSIPGSTNTCIVDTISSNILTINLQPPPESLQSINISPQNGSLCAGQTYTLSAIPNNNPDEISWYDRDPTISGVTSIGSGASIPVATAETYYVRREDGCSMSEAISENVAYFIQPPAIISPDMIPTNPVCPEDDTTLSVTGGNGGIIKWYAQSGGMGNVLKEGNTYDVSPDLTTTYYVRSEGMCNLISNELDITVTVLQPPPPLNNITVMPTDYCEGEEITLTVTPDNTPSQIFWYDQPNGVGNSLGVGDTLTIQATNQTYYVRRENGCQNGNSTDTSFELMPLPGLSAAFNLPENVCIGDMLTLQATQQDDVTYQWAFTNASADADDVSGPINISFPEQGESEISLTVTNSGCEVMNSKTINVLDEIQISIDDNSLENNIPEFEIAANTMIMYELSPDSENVEYTWSCELESGNLEGNSGSGTGAIISNAWNLPNGEPEAGLLCTVNATGQCDGTGQFRLIVRPPIFIPDVITVNGDGFNDCWDIITISQAAENFTIKLYNRSGKCVRGCDDTFTVGEAQIWCGEGCPAGAYWYIVEGADGFKETGALTLIR